MRQTITTFTLLVTLCSGCAATQLPATIPAASLSPVFQASHLTRDPYMQAVMKTIEVVNPTDDEIRAHLSCGAWMFEVTISPRSSSRAFVDSSSMRALDSLCNLTWIASP